MAEDFYVTWEQEGEERVPYLNLKVRAPHPQVLPFYPSYDPDKKSPLAVEDYRKADNCCGHTQRALLNYWSIRAFVETGESSLELGSAGVHDIFCLATDHISTGEVPVYGGKYSGIQLHTDATDLSRFGPDSFGAVLNNHLCEHLPCNRIREGATQEEKYQFQCDGSEIAKFLDGWMRVIKPGGFLIMVMPDERPARVVNSSTLFYDPSHMHAFEPDGFMKNVLLNLKTPFEIVKYDTLQNNFSFDVILRKK